MIDPFWAYLACFVIVMGGAPTIEWCNKRKLLTLGKSLSILLLLASAVIFIKGFFMASDWSNPFAGKSVELAQAVHSPKGWLVVAVISVWPYFLMVISGLTTIAGATLLMQRDEIPN